jgi:membrane-bound lytic murein transglycosylase A
VLVKRPDWKEPCTIARQVNADSDKAIRLFFETFFVPNQSSLPMAPVRACYGLL